VPDVGFGSWLRENAEIEFANGNFVSTSINLKNKSAGDGCRDKTIEKTILRAFRARRFHAARVIRVVLTVGLCVRRHVSKVPGTDSCTAAKIDQRQAPKPK
jgi:hypothetical protein